MVNYDSAEAPGGDFSPEILQQTLGMFSNLVGQALNGVQFKDFSVSLSPDEILLSRYGEKVVLSRSSRVPYLEYSAIEHEEEVAFWRFTKIELDTNRMVSRGWRTSHMEKIDSAEGLNNEHLIALQQLLQRLERGNEVHQARRSRLAAALGSLIKPTKTNK